MMRASVTASGLHVDVHHLQGSAPANQDRWLVQPLDRAVRVAVIDGVTPRAALPKPGDAAQWASAVTAAHLLLPGPLAERLQDANAEVHDPAVSPSRRQAMAAVAAIDVSRDGDFVVGTCAVAADCEVYVADPHLRLVAGGDFITAEARASLEEMRRRAVPEGVRLAAESELLDRPGVQLRNAVGRYASPSFAFADVSAPCVVLATDGARLSSAAAAGATAADLPEHLASVASSSSRDDLTCAVITIV